jgi:hypothetical protein
MVQSSSFARPATAGTFKGSSVLKTFRVLLLVFTLSVASLGAITYAFSFRIVLLPHISNEEPGKTVIMRGLYMLPLITDLGRICIDPDAHVVTASEVKICSASVLTALSRHGFVVAQLPHMGVLSELAENRRAGRWAPGKVELFRVITMGTPRSYG